MNPNKVGQPSKVGQPPKVGQPIFTGQLVTCIEKHSVGVDYCIVTCPRMRGDGSGKQICNPHLTK